MRKFTPYPIRETSWTDKSNYFSFHKGRDRKNDDTVQLNDAIKGLIKKVELIEYVKGEKRQGRVT